MSSDDPAKPDATDNDAWALAEAEAQAAEAEAQAARARAKLLKLQRDRAQTPPNAEEAGTVELPDASEPAEPDEPVADSTGGPAQPQQRSGVWKLLPWVAATLAVLAIGGLIVADVGMLVHHRGATQRQHQTAEYAAAARQGVVTLMSLNYETVDDDVQRIIDNSAGDFKKEFESHAEDFTKTARESKTITEATATVAGVESMSDAEAVVLVAASTKVTNKAGAKDEPRNWRLTVHLTREDGQVKMSKVDFAT